MSSAGYRPSRDRQRLLWRIHRRYVTTTESVRVGQFSLAFTRIADPDRVLDEVAEEADRHERRTGRRESDEQLHLPYWAELWESARGVGQFLAEGSQEGSGFGVQGSGSSVAGSSPNPEPRTLNPGSEPRTLNPPSVLDLGCGMGLSGAVAAALGARVLLADIEPPALLFARLNTLPWAGRVRSRRLDWRIDRLTETFDLILGADILYERSQWDFLEPFWRSHLALGGAVVLGEPGRQTGDLFMDWIGSRGWELRLFEEKLPTRERPIRIFRLSSLPS